MDIGATSSQRGWIWPIAIAVLIFAASSRSTVAGPRLPYFDKVVHFSVYGLLGTLVCRQGRGWRAAAWSVLAVAAFGATDEWHQSFVPGRESELADWVADTSGAAVAIAMYAGWQRYREWLERPLGRRVENSGEMPRVAGHERTVD